MGKATAESRTRISPSRYWTRSKIRNSPGSDSLPGTDGAWPDISIGAVAQFGDLELPGRRGDSRTLRSARYRGRFIPREHLRQHRWFSVSAHKDLRRPADSLSCEFRRSESAFLRPAP